MTAEAALVDVILSPELAAYTSALFGAVVLGRLFRAAGRIGAYLYVVVAFCCFLVVVYGVAIGAPYSLLPEPFGRWYFIWMSILPSAGMFMLAAPRGRKTAASRPPVGKLVWNEKVKLTASFFDRLATTCLTAGVATPMVAYLLDVGEMRLKTGLGLLAGCTILWALLAILCHVGARTLLGSLRDD